MIVREATRDDLADIVAMLSDDVIGKDRESAGDPAYGRAFEAMSTQPDNMYLVADQGGEVVGCLQYTVIHGLSRRGASRAQIEGVRVSSANRGGGIGETLIGAAIERARADGCALVQLTTDRKREDALRFYERLGFEASHWGMKLAL